MWSRLAVASAVVLTPACATTKRVSYNAVPLGAGEYAMTFVSIDLPDDIHAASLSRRASSTCSGAYALRDVDETQIVGLDYAKNTPRKTTKAILSCEKKSG